jgi:hypothetical protein
MSHSFVPKVTIAQLAENGAPSPSRTTHYRLAEQYHRDAETGTPTGPQPMISKSCLFCFDIAGRIFKKFSGSPVIFPAREFQHPTSLEIVLQ